MPLNPPPVGLLLVGPAGTSFAREFRAEWMICWCDEASRELGWRDLIRKEFYHIRLIEQNERKFLCLIRTFLDALAARHNAATATEEVLLTFARVIPPELSLATDVEITTEGKVIEALDKWYVEFSELPCVDNR
ncbi:hypothetical protein WOLCODRAFT_157717 [Wolfiporia cocos MD-104 SS10]|uniref:Uncharacterized protein n=1 Tax=Wolfiporia cocos (strain MD-104) TaxID=742152 RepID=A0A2H3JLY0_WOLCO|nr:hypothetical protein WOLCODRAFT_157717 [Wolfiporia cocos MD-104 SS10]